MSTLDVTIVNFWFSKNVFIKLIWLLIITDLPILSESCQPVYRQNLKVLGFWSKKWQCSSVCF